MDYEKLTEDQKAKVRGARTPDELLAIAREEGYELTDDELEAVSGGICGWENCKSYEKGDCGLVGH